MRIALYGNGSSGNHGCEAIVRGTYTLIKEPLTILSEEMDEDIIYGLAKFCNVLDAKNGKISKARLIRAYMKLKLKNNLLVACINRNGQTIIPDGDDCIKIGDSVIIVTTHTGFNDIEDILS